MIQISPFFSPVRLQTIIFSSIVSFLQIRSGGKIPKSYYLKEQHLSGSSNLKKVTVGYGAKLELPFEVTEPSSGLRYVFSLGATVSKDPGPTSSSRKILLDKFLCLAKIELAPAKTMQT